MKQNSNSSIIGRALASVAGFDRSRCRTIVSCGNNFKSKQYPIILFLKYKQYIILNIVYVLFTSHTIQSCGSEGVWLRIAQCEQKQANRNRK